MSAAGMPGSPKRMLVQLVTVGVAIGFGRWIVSVSVLLSPGCSRCGPPARSQLVTRARVMHAQPGRAGESRAGRQVVANQHLARVVVRALVGELELIGAVRSGVAVGGAALLNREIEVAGKRQHVDRMAVLVGVSVGLAVVGAHLGPVDLGAIVDGPAGDLRPAA